jgi:hypothetical protein
MENKDGQQKNGKQTMAFYFIEGYCGKQKNGKQKWKTNNTTKIITYLQVKW